MGANNRPLEQDFGLIWFEYFGDARYLDLKHNQHGPSSRIERSS